MGIANILPLIGPQSTHVGCVGKLLLVVVFVIPTGAPLGISGGDELLP